MKLPLLALTTCLAVATALPADETSADGFVDLFDGATLRGWKRLGGKATYRVEDGTIVGTTAPRTPNTFLVTERTYGDFVLELEFKVDPVLNSGVQIRSLVRPNGRVGGYQVEIDPDTERARFWSGGIYDENRRGWLYPLDGNEAARRALRHGEWNAFRVVCRGDSIRTWLNGVPAADLVDSMTLEGFIGLQVHSYRPKPGKPESASVRWRAIRLKDLGRHRWKPLWDGKSLDGWTAEGGGTWTIEDGAIVGRNPASEKRHGHLFLDAPQKDFTIRMRFRATEGNSGFYFRTEKQPGDLGIAGFQADIDAARDTGGLYETGGRGWVARPAAKVFEKHFRPGEWNEMTVSAHGKRVAVHVNGAKFSEVRDDPGRREGLIALQVHGGQDVEVRFRDLEMLAPAGRGAPEK